MGHYFSDQCRRASEETFLMVDHAPDGMCSKLKQASQLLLSAAAELDRLTVENEVLAETQERMETHVFQNDLFGYAFHAFHLVYPDLPVPHVRWEDDWDFNDHVLEMRYPEHDEAVIVSIHVDNSVYRAVECMLNAFARAVCYYQELPIPETLEEFNSDKGAECREAFGMLQKQLAELLIAEE